MAALPDLPAGAYRHYKGFLAMTLGYAHDSNDDSRTVVVYVSLEFGGARKSTRMAVRTVADFFAIVDPATGEAVDLDEPTEGRPRRFTYLGPVVERDGLSL